MLKPTNYLLLLALWVAFIQMAFGQQKLRIVASASMIADIATNIVGNGQSIETLVPVGGDPHLHEPTPSNARQVAEADLILINGLTFEGWITELIENSGTDAQVITATQGIDVLSSSTYANSADPHAWMDASNGILYATNIANALIELDPLEEDSYLRNLSAYTDRLNKLDTEIAAMVSTIPASQRVLVTSHDAFQYFGRRYGIRLEAIMGISTEAEAQTADIRRVSRAIRESNIPAIFIESTINPKLIQQIAQDNGVAIGGKLYADSLGDEKSEASTYIDMLRYNAETIVEALSSNDGLVEAPRQSFSWLLYMAVGVLMIICTLVFVRMMQS